MTNGTSPKITASLVICTYNRAGLLRDAIEGALAQLEVPSYELLIVDNNSSDGTRELVSKYLYDPRVRYVFEPKQGLSHARNRGMHECHSEIIVFPDDDVRLDSRWLRIALDALEHQPEIAFVGGRVLPIWPSEPPAWLTPEHWAPLALFDYGPLRREITPADAICIGGGNMACRRRVLLDVGEFSPHLQHKRGAFSAVEDHEWQWRAMSKGYCGLYIPELVMRAPVDPRRMTPEYHRKWHRDHGRAVAALDQLDEQLAAIGGRSRKSRSRLLPRSLEPWLLKDIVRCGVRAGWFRLIGQTDASLQSEMRVHELIGYSLGRAATR